MKIGGIEAKTAWEPKPIYLDRGFHKDGRPRVMEIRARGIKDYDHFESICPKPKNHSGAITPEGWVEDEEAPEYLDAMKVWKELRWAYTVIYTLYNTDWETVDRNNKKTWLNWSSEMESDLSITEQGLVMDLVNSANHIGPAKLEENRRSFFQSQDELASQSQTGQEEDPENTTSSELVHAASSDPQD